MDKESHVPSEIMKYFDYHHLLPHLGSVSEPFYNLATHIDSSLPDCAEKAVALRKLLEAKDAAVRASL